MGGCDGLREDAKRRLERMKEYCTPDSRMRKMIAAAEKGLSYRQTAAIIPGLDWDTYRFFMGARAGEEPQKITRQEFQRVRMAIRDSIFGMIGSGATIEEIAERHRIDRSAVYDYIARYVRKYGIKREELACVQAEAGRMQMSRHMARLGLIRARKRKGLTMEEVADSVGVHRNHYMRIECGSKSTIDANWRALAQLLDASVAELKEQTEVIIPYRKKLSQYVDEIDGKG